MQVEAKKSFTHGFVINEAELRRIIDLLVEQHGKLPESRDISQKYRIKYRNGAIAETASIDEILSQENVASAQVIRIQLSITSTAGGDSILTSLDFVNADLDDYEGLVSIRFSISGNSRDWVFVTSSLLEERIERIKRICPNQLSLGKRTSPFRLVASMVLSMMLVIASLMFSLFARDKPAELLEAAYKSGKITNPIEALILIEKTKEQPLGNINNIFFVLLAVLAFLGVTTWFFFKYYPVFNFCWGDYVEEYRRKESIRKFVMVVVVLGLVISILGGVIANLTGITAIKG